MKMKNLKQPLFCNGCCYRRTCEYELEKCCYLVKKKCLLKDGYIIYEY